MSEGRVRWPDEYREGGRPEGREGGREGREGGREGGGREETSPSHHTDLGGDLSPSCSRRRQSKKWQTCKLKQQTCNIVRTADFHFTV